MNITSIDLIRQISASVALPEINYGNKELFPQLKEEGIQILTNFLNSFKGLPSSNNSKVDNYKKFLELAGQIRHDIAVKTGTPNTELFGRLRNKSLRTSLYASNYLDTNDKIKELFIKSIDGCNGTSHYSRTKGDIKYEFTKETSDDLIKKYRPTLVEMCAAEQGFEITKERLDDTQFRRGLEHISMLRGAGKYHRRLNKPLTEFLYSPNINEVTVTFASGIFEVLKKHDNNIQINHIGYLTDHEEKIRPQDEILDAENTYILSGTISIRNNDGWDVLTRQYGFIGCDENGKIGKDDRKTFLESHTITLYHTEPRDIASQEQVMANLLDNILNGSVKGDRLKKLIKNFEYRFHHLCYYGRGSAAISEMVIKAITNTVSCENYEPLQNLEVMTEPFLL